MTLPLGSLKQNHFPAFSSELVTNMALEQTSPTTRLLTLLNVSAARSTKRKRNEADSSPITKLNKRRSLEPAVSEPEKSNEESVDATKVDDTEEKVEAEEVKDDGALHCYSQWTPTLCGPKDPTDPYEYHFGLKPAPLTESSRMAVDEGNWTSFTSSLRKLGTVVECTPSSSSTPEQVSKGQQSVSLHIPYSCGVAY